MEQLSKVINSLVRNPFDKTIELLTLVFCGWRREIQKETPKVDTAESTEKNDQKSDR